MKKLLAAIAITSSFASAFASVSAFAADAEEKQYPNASGQVLFELKSDRIIKSDNNLTPPTNTYINIEPDLSLNIDKNWSVKTGWRIFPQYQRNYASPEKTRAILSDNRGFNQDDTGVVVEELKVAFKNDDMKFSAGKINPTFATMYRKTKRLGVFVTDFTEEYELREKIGASIAALLEDSEITFSTFFNDTSGLSSSAIQNRGRERTNDGTAGNTSTLSSYTMTIEGQKLFGKENLFYNFGYRSLGVNNNGLNKREIGYSGNLEYLYKVSNETSIIPLIEIVKINNFTGLNNREARYVTTSLIGKYSRWTASVASVLRDISHNYPTASTVNTHDKELQLSIGYKFTNDLAIDVSRAHIEENGHNASMVGVIFSYLYKF